MKGLSFVVGLALCAGSVLAVQPVTSATGGTVGKIDAVAKTIAVKTADGAEHTFHFVGRTTVHGAEAAAKGTKDTLHGLKEGSEVVVHYTSRGAVDTADEIDDIGKDGLKAAERTVEKLDRGAKVITVKAADGTEETYRLTERAAHNAGRDIAEGTEKSAKVTVYYTDQGGHKVAHFFKKVV